MSIQPSNSWFICIAVIGVFAPNTIRAEVDFNREIRPILAKHCFACHGPDSKARKADLRLDTKEGSQVDLGGYSAIAPGKPDLSELLNRIESSDPDEIMPPPEHGEPLKAPERKILREWIASGADYQVHWAFVRPQKSTVPEVRDGSWPKSPIDYFTLAQMELRDLTPSPEADRDLLIRRVSLDLTGLPPTLEEADSFRDDESPYAFEKVVDRLLASSAFGEHWARMWLDLARYADTKGYEKDRHRNIWLYRDWVINALNNDMPYDQFTIEQLAGDLLPSPDNQQMLATAFHRNTMTNEEGGTDNEEFRIAAVKDRVDTTIQVWMGLTMGCAKCHSHKYDPISQKNYYEFFAIFNQTQDKDQEAPFWETSSNKQKSEIKTLREKISKLDSDPDKEKDLVSLRKRLKNLENQKIKTPVMLELPKDKRRTTRIHQRGNFLTKGETVEPSLLPIFGNQNSGKSVNRLDVAMGLMEKTNPLTARVMVNRIWARLFGVGLVETEEDFGSQGLPPTHPKLLDWLAIEYQDQAWSLKKILRTIVLSKTYRQDSKINKNSLSKDPNNRWLSRGASFRLSAEMVRDQALAISGLLTTKVGGPSVMPPQPPGVWKTTYSCVDWKNAEGPDRYRRAIYTYLKRTSPHPAMTAFDAGSGEVCQIRRVRTNTPLQALVTLNDVSFIEAAAALSQRMNQSSANLNEKLHNGFRYVLVRQPDKRELDQLVNLYQKLKTEFDSNPDSAQKLLSYSRLKIGDPALVGVANVLLNLDEALMK